mgnify:CR=1 FL=1
MTKTRDSRSILGRNLSRRTALKGLGAVTVASPAPKVFSATRGFETYSSRFEIVWQEVDGKERRMPIDAERYASLAGPYRRRNVFGAALSYAPVLGSDPKTAPMLQQVLRYAMCDEARLLQELGVNRRAIVGNPRVVLYPAPGTNPENLPTSFEAPCRK